MFMNKNEFSIFLVSLGTYRALSTETEITVKKVEFSNIQGYKEKS